jgi:phosphoglycolate phosphatase-like HAD superfamily hydrolase
MIRLVLFDIDGTLVRTGGAGVKAFRKVFETEFNAVDGFENLKFAGRTDTSLVREFFIVHGVPATKPNFQRFFECYVFWLDHILAQSETRTCPGIVSFIEQLKVLPQPPLLGLLTGNIRLGAEIKLRHFGLWQEFETGGFADDSEDRNEIAAIARRRGCRLLQEELRPDQVLVIGDTSLDIRCGRSIQARVLAVATGGSTLEELKEYEPDWLLPTLEGMPASEIINKEAKPVTIDFRVQTPV